VVKPDARFPEPIGLPKIDVFLDIIRAGINAILARIDARDARHGASAGEAKLSILKQNPEKHQVIADKGSSRCFPHSKNRS
jgi:hypothetical protein